MGCSFVCEICNIPIEPPPTGYSVCYGVKYTTRNPNQLPTTPIAEYELVNIKGRNSYFFPNTSSCIREQYNISGIETAM